MQQNNYYQNNCYQAPFTIFRWMHPAGQMVHPTPALCSFGRCLAGGERQLYSPPPASLHLMAASLACQLGWTRQQARQRQENICRRDKRPKASMGNPIPTTHSQTRAAVPGSAGALAASSGRALRRS